jgi:hypothetical protein
LAPGGLVHIRSRFVDGRFEFDLPATRQYLRRLDSALRDCDWVLISYAVMTSHIHLGMIVGEVSLRAWLHPLHTAIAGWINARRRASEAKTLGPVFGDRPATNPVPFDGAFPLIAYHHNNPRKAGMVARALESPRTSHRQYLGLPSESYVAALDTRRGLELCGMDRTTFAERVDDVCDDLSWAEEGLGLVIRVVSERYAVDEEELCGGSRARRVVFARRVVATTATCLGYSPVKIASALRVSRQAVRRALQTSSSEVRELGHAIAEEWGAGS